MIGSRQQKCNAKSDVLINRNYNLQVKWLNGVLAKTWGVYY